MLHFLRDHVQWTEEDKENARQKAEENSCVQIPVKEQGKNVLQSIFPSLISLWSQVK